MILNLGTRVVNNWLISSEAGLILIDTGYAGGFPRLRRRLEKNGIRPEEIRFFFLTHAHDDHAGFLNEVLAATDALVILHPKAIRGLQRGQNSFAGGCSSGLAWLFCQVLALLGHGAHKYPPIRQEYLDRLIPVDSERFRALGFPCEIVRTPGHTEDHIALLAGDVMFCGDAAMNGFPSRRRTIIWIENPAQYRQSWQTILVNAPRMLYPAHGKPFPAEDLKKHLASLDKIRLRSLHGRGKAGKPVREN